MHWTSDTLCSHMYITCNLAGAAICIFVFNEPFMNEWMNEWMNHIEIALNTYSSSLLNFKICFGVCSYNLFFLQRLSTHNKVIQSYYPSIMQLFKSYIIKSQMFEFDILKKLKKSHPHGMKESVYLWQSLQKLITLKKNLICKKHCAAVDNVYHF